jgi:deoxyribodipyrimidine photolyase-related protein
MIAALIYPHQLFPRHPALAGADMVVMVEEPLFFSQYRFHAQKLILHRASMKYYARELQKQGMQVKYIDARELASSGHVAALLKQWNVAHIQFVDPIDDWLEQRLIKALNKTRLPFTILEDPHFLTPLDVIELFAESREIAASGDVHLTRPGSVNARTNRADSGKPQRAVSNLKWIGHQSSGLPESLKSAAAEEQKKNSKPLWFFTDFYIAQRKRMKILLDEKNKPVGGKWSFDSENRKKMPPGLGVPDLFRLQTNDLVTEATEYVVRHFPQAPGSAGSFRYPIDRQSALKWLDDFIEQRLILFGDYEDAIVVDDSFLFHSVLTPVLNIGLLSPQEVVDAALQQLERVPMNSLEGFVRQVIGWREFIRAVYLKLGRRQRIRNYWQHHRPMPTSFYEGTTGIDPFDTVIRRLLKHAYAHHIERLMVLGNLMLLCEIDPEAIYQWFMELFIDAYDWVMVPNVYGMSQYADGGLITTKPYISGSAYILRMSNFKKGDWCPIWDALYWNFIDKHREFFSSNPRMSVMVAQCERMGAKLDQHRVVAAHFLEKLQ